MYVLNSKYDGLPTSLTGELFCLLYIMGNPAPIPKQLDTLCLVLVSLLCAQTMDS